MPPLPPASPRLALTRLRIIWTALLLGPILLFATLVLGAIPAAPGAPDPSLLRLLHYLSIALAAVLLPMGYFIRLQSYKKHWVVNAVSPQGYMTGNLILLALCESVAFFSIITAFLAGAIVPFILPAIVASMVQIINWPTGRPMEPADMELPRR